jgi:tripartite-type tricarboxylate transporter receptor subunit TctC
MVVTSSPTTSVTYPRWHSLSSPALKDRYTSFGYQLVGGTPKQFAEHARKETAKRADVVKRSGSKIE